VNVAIIGGTRFIGHAAAAELVDRGHAVTVLHRGRHALEVEGVADVLVDRRDPSALALALARVAPDAVVDTYAMTRADAQVTALAASIVKVPLVVLSSQDVYAAWGRLLGHPAPALSSLAVDETAPLTVPYPYRGVADHEGGPGYDKKDVEGVLEEAARERGIAVTMLRLAAIYGRRDPKRRFAGIVAAFDGGARELVTANQASFRCTHAHVEDAAHAVVLACEQPAAGYRVFNVGEATTPSMRERVESIAAALGIAFTWREGESGYCDPLLGRFAGDFVLDDARIRRELGFRETTTEAARVADVIEWSRRSR
jgi:nucleoside-diphosphate-sugar epimerase